LGDKSPSTKADALVVSGLVAPTSRQKIPVILPRDAPDCRFSFCFLGPDRPTPPRADNVGIPVPFAPKRDRITDKPRRHRTFRRLQLLKNKSVGNSRTTPFIRSARLQTSRFGTKPHSGCCARDLTRIFPIWAVASQRSQSKGRMVASLIDSPGVCSQSSHAGQQETHHQEAPKKLASLHPGNTLWAGPPQKGEGHLAETAHIMRDRAISNKGLAPTPVVVQGTVSAAPQVETVRRLRHPGSKIRDLLVRFGIFRRPPC